MDILKISAALKTYQAQLHIEEKELAEKLRLAVSVQLMAKGCL